MSRITIIILILFFSLSTTSVLSQDIPSIGGKNGLLKIGNMAYQKGEYSRAIKYFKKSLEINPDQIEVMVKIGNSYRFLNQLNEAETYYEKVFQRKSTTKETEYFYNYGKLLMTLGKREKARILLNRYGGVEGMERVEGLLESIDSYSNFFSDSMAYSVDPVWFNTTKSDNSPAYYEDGILFLSAINPQTFQKNKNKKQKAGFLKTYYLPSADENSQLAKFSKLGKTKYHEGPLVFFDNENQVYFTRINAFGKKNQFRRALYQATFDDSNENVKIVPLPFNSPNYSVGQPATNESGTTLIFASNMPGGYGGSDLYISYKEDGKWVAPTNLGSNINTSGDEFFPFLSNNNDLYFSSDGHSGLGGLDIFRTSLTAGATVLNPGFPMNSSYDDHGLVINDQGNMGYFSSSRATGIGSDDIYKFEVFLIKVSSRLVSAETGTTMNGEFKVTDLANGEEVPYTIENDLITFNGLVGKNYQIVAKIDENNVFTKDIALDSFTSDTYAADINFKEKELAKAITIQLELRHRYTKKHFNGSLTVVDEITRENVPVRLGADSSELVITGLSNRTYVISGQEQDFEAFEDSFSTATKNKDLTKLVLKRSFTSIPDMSSGSKYENGIPVSVVVTSNGLEEVGYLQWGAEWLSIDMDTLASFAQKESLFVESKTIMDTPQFDFNRSLLNREVKSGLDSLLEVLMVSSPSLLLVGHSDSSGADDYNLKLSEKRAKSVEDYLLKKGYPAEKIKIEFLGEKEPLKNCESCSKGENRINRRVEIVINGSY